LDMIQDLKSLPFGSALLWCGLNFSGSIDQIRA
jgi:hypothetical protein